MMKVFSTKNQKTVHVTFCDEFAQAKTADGQIIGEFHFSERDDDVNCWILVTNMHLEGPAGSKAYVGQGIGAFIVREAEEYFGLPICFARPHGGVRNDGAHLTGSGPAFAQKMVESGIACWEP